MKHRTGRIPPRRLAAAGALGLGLAGSLSADAAPSTTPTLKVTSQVAGQPSPAAFATGEWTSADGVWTLPLRSWSLPGGTTTVTATWRSPVFRPARNKAAFASHVAVMHQGVAGTEAVEQSFRFCQAPARCSRWEAIGSKEVPDNIDPESIPYRITTGNGLELGWRRPPAPIWIEWRYTHTQQGASYAENTIRVAVGAAATRVD